MRTDARNPGTGRFATLLIVIGISFLIYGLGFHAIPVVGEQKEEEAGTFEEFPDDNPFFPGKNAQKPAEKLAVHWTPESEIMKEVSRGGVVRDASGDIRKTYTGKPPETCPT